MPCQEFQRWVVQDTELPAAGHEVAAGTSSRHVQTQHCPEDDRQSISPGVPHEQVLLPPVDFFVMSLVTCPPQEQSQGRELYCFDLFRTKEPY